MTHHIVTLQGRQFFAILFPVENNGEMCNANFQWLRTWCLSSCSNQSRTLRTNVGVIEIRKIFAYSKISFQQYLDTICPTLETITHKKSFSLLSLPDGRQVIDMISLNRKSYTCAAKQ